MSITAVEQIPVGTLLTQDQADSLPVGSVVKPGGAFRARLITKEREGSCKWRKTSGWVLQGGDGSTTPLSNRFNTLVSVPVARGPESLAEFKARFAARVREVTAEYTPTHRRVAERVLSDLNAYTGGGADDSGLVAAGTLAMRGGPDEPGFTIWRYEGAEGWVRQYGTADLDQCAVKTKAAAAVDLDGFRALAWEQGQAVKQRFRWCSVFDTVMAEFGIVDPTPGPDFSPWETLVKAQEGRDKLPLGSVIGESKGDWGVFVKTCHDGGPDDWTRVCGTRPVAAGTMRLLHMGGRPMHIVDNGLSEFMPGCVVRDGHIIRLP